MCVSAPTLSLYNTSTDGDTYSGIVQVTIGGITGRVCLNQWGHEEANVTCRSLGYRGGVPYVHVTLNTRPILMSNVTCTGREASLFDCTYQMWGDSGPCKHNAHEAGVICYRNKGKLIVHFSMSPQNISTIISVHQWQIHDFPLGGGANPVKGYADVRQKHMQKRKIWVPLGVGIGA